MSRRLMVWAALVLAPAAAQPVPSTWEGRLRGLAAGQSFDLPLVIELRQPLASEQNPCHLFAGTEAEGQVGALTLVSALEVATGGRIIGYEAGRIGIYTRDRAWDPGRGNLTVRFFQLRREANALSGTLGDPGTGISAAVNGFTGPNISAREASEVTRAIHEALGPTEMFLFERGATIRLEFRQGTLTGTVQGSGRSVMNTSSPVPYRAQIEAKRKK